MEDPVLNRSLEETKELQARWAQLRDFYNMAARGGQRVTSQGEMKFLELKSRIAMLHDGFMEKLQHDQKTGQNIMSIVGDCILLGRVINASDAEKQKFEFDWNECYMLITEQVGSLEEEKERLANINEKAYKAQKRKEELQAKFYNFIHSNGMKYTIILAVVFMVVYGIPAFGIFDYREFGRISITKPVYKIFVNLVYRPVFDKDLAYLSFDEIPLNDKAMEGLPASIKPATDQPLSDQTLKTSELASMGLSGKSMQDAMGALAKSGVNVTTERFSAEGQDTRFYWIFFPDTETAKAFTQAVQETAKAMNDATRSDMISKTYLLRSANFVMLGRGTHIHREAYVKNKWKLDEKTPNLLQ